MTTKPFAFISKSLLLVLPFAMLFSDANAQTVAVKKKAPNPALAPVEDVEGVPRVLLIGDSISIGYTVAVRDLMKGKANVHRPLTNCGPTTKGLESIDDWLKTGGEGKSWDVIHFNWGLHDLKYMGPEGENLSDPDSPKSAPQVSQEDYRKNLTSLVETMKATGATLIFRNTTPVPAGARGRVVGDSVIYNAIAAEVMNEAGVQVHDLYSFAKEHEAEIQKKADVHYTPEGSIALAEEVVRVISAALAE
ncbi:MAG: SGNH/GDSL hydrolase family protein [Verrucomicrobiales bacterium]|nr:SGNH/GDSL hydrolase family protein [Verrucomicrobiales bacterium]